MKFKEFCIKVCRHYRGGTLKLKFQQTIQRAIGIEKHQDNIDTLYYFLNAFVEPTMCPTTKDINLRNLQECDAVFLAIFDKLCNKYGLTYWLDYGTLLGSYRHRGFVPWDDDMDIAMPRKDYLRFAEVFKDEFERYNIQVYYWGTHTSIGYRHNETGVYLDIFAVDEYYTENTGDKAITEVSDRIKRYQKKYYIDVLNPPSKENVDGYRINTIGGYDKKTKSNVVIYHSPEFRHQPQLIHLYDEVYPLGKIYFEGMEFSCPRDVGLYLTRIYGCNYMKFPKGGVCHHGSIQNNASRHNVCMEDVKKYLIGVLNEI